MIVARFLAHGHLTEVEKLNLRISGVLHQLIDRRLFQLVIVRTLGHDTHHDLRFVRIHHAGELGLQVRVLLFGLLHGGFPALSRQHTSFAAGLLRVVDQERYGLHGTFGQRLRGLWNGKRGK